MQAAYLYLNAVLYLVFAIWCSVAPTKTSAALGYTALSRGGRSEYLVIYGGLQLGLALAFWLAARHPELRRVGVVAAIGLYAPIVAYRVCTVFANWPVGALTVATGILEAALLVAGLGIWAA